MAEQILDTRGAVVDEGYDPLREFLLKYKDTLKLCDVQRLNAVLESLATNDITYDELIEYKSADLRGLQQMDILQPLQATRFIKLLSTIKESAIYQEIQSTIIIVLSHDEEKAIQDIQNKTTKINKILSNTSTRMNELRENVQNGHDIINNEFAIITQKVNERKKELLLQFDKQINVKKQTLQQEQNYFVGYKNDLNECYENIQQLLQNNSLDPIQRKSNILALTKQILNLEKQQKIYTCSTVKMNKQRKIFPRIDIDDVSAMLATTGHFEQGSPPNPSIAEIKEIHSTAVRIIIHFDNKCIKPDKHKIEYCLDDDDDDVKVEWISFEQDIKDEKEMITLNELTEDRNYLFRVSTHNIFGWGPASNVIKFKTIKKRNKMNTLQFKFDIIHNTHRDYIKQNGRVFSRPSQGTMSKIFGNNYTQAWFSVCSSTTIQHGIQQFKIKFSKGKSPQSEAIGIMSNTKTCECEDQACYDAKANVYYYEGYGRIKAGKYTTNKSVIQIGLKKWRVNDIITVIVNCNDWTVQFMNNNIEIGKPIKIQPNISYHPFIFSWSYDTEFEMLINN